MVALALIALLAGRGARSAAQPAPNPTKDAAAIIGTWTGSSVCMATTGDPACRSGNVAFAFAADPGAPLKFKCRITRPGTTITEPPGDVIFTYDAAGKQWMGDYTTSFGTVRWTLHIANAQSVYGYLVQLPLLHVNRRVNLKRVGLK